MSDIKPRKPLLVRIPEDLHDELKREAYDLRLSLNEVVTEALVMRLRAPNKAQVLPWLEQLGHARREVRRP